MTYQARLWDTHTHTRSFFQILVRLLGSTLTAFINGHSPNDKQQAQHQAVLAKSAGITERVKTGLFFSCYTCTFLRLFTGK